jgi:DNA-directed RNA polymerase specialized sigma24 family protein
VVDRHRRALGVTIVASEDDYDLGDDATPALAALRDLPTEQRLAVEQYVIDEVCHVEIASRSGDKPAAIRKRVSRGLQAIHRSLNPL